MKRLLAIAFGLLISAVAQADIWKWVDANGKTYFVDTNTAIFTWVDEFDKVHFSDMPEHPNAVSVQLVWHSSGDLADTEEGSQEEKVSKSNARPDESDEERKERELAEAYYCKRAQEIYDSYTSAPRLYKTAADGERAYLSDEETAQMLVETKDKVDELCG